MTYISGEEMTRYTMELILEQWIRPHIDISKWEFFDLSCKARDATNDKVLHDAVASGARMCAIFKEPTITPSAVLPPLRPYITTKHYFTCPFTLTQHPTHSHILTLGSSERNGIEKGTSRFLSCYTIIDVTNHHLMLLTSIVHHLLTYHLSGLGFTQRCNATRMEWYHHQS